MQQKFLTFEDRVPDSTFVERIWTARSLRAGEFPSVVAGHWEMVVTRLHGRAFLTVRGPETRATPVDCPPDGDWVGVRFKLGTFWPAFLPGTLRDRRDVTLHGASTRSFWLNSSAWSIDVREFGRIVARLVAKLIRRDPIVETVLDGGRHGVSVRSAQRRFARATGITYAAYRTIERARYATNLLREGIPSSMSSIGPDTSTSRTSRALEIPNRADAVGGRTLDATVVVFMQDHQRRYVLW